MQYYLCYVGFFDGADEVLADCLEKRIYQYHEDTLQTGAGNAIKKGDMLILVYQKKVVAYGIAEGPISSAKGYSECWKATSVDNWVRTDQKDGFPLPYGVFSHTLVGNKQSVVKEIDSLWANELVLQITLRNEMLKNPSEPALYMHLSTIATFFQKGFISMPAVQRGKVWNAVRVEVLWDSILRGISIGSMCARPIEGEQCKWELLDGQQRVNAINLGYEDFPTEKSGENTSILWLDIAMNPDSTEHNDGKITSDRKFFFRVTTPGHPWGYNLSDNETRNSLLSTDEKRTALQAIKENWDFSSNPSKKPKTRDLWPIKAKFPVPFFAIREFFERWPTGHFTDFWNYCRNKYGETNWFKYYDIHKTDASNWACIRKAVNSISSRVVVFQNLSCINDSDIGLYFKRLNKAGVVPSDEEIRYSLLKSKCPALKDLDNIAEQRMPPAAMADVAMLSYLTQKDKKWNFNVREHISALAKDESFRNYVKKDNGELSNIISAMEKRIIYNPTSNQIGLPKYLLSSIALSRRGIYRLLIFFQKEWNNTINIERLVALITLVWWLGNDKMISYGYEIFKSIDRTDEKWEEASKHWLVEAVQRGDMIPPSPACYYNFKNSIYESKNWNDDVMQKLGYLPYFDGINKMWSWESKEGRALLLYVCREYVQKEFPDYDPSDAVWSEENRPWDYDHIFPKNWLITGRGNRQGIYHDIVAKFIHSIGNIAPIHFSKNRQKNAEYPGEYMSADNKLLFVDYNDKTKDLFSTNIGKELENNPLFSIPFVRTTMNRFYQLYDAWYSPRSLNIDSLFDFKDKRRLLFESIMSNLKNANIESKVFFACNDGRQYECTCNADWARQWLSIIVPNTNNTPSPAVTANNTIIEYGLRRHPNQNSMDGRQDRWWTETEYDKISYENENCNPDFFAKTILNLIKIQESSNK